MKPLVAVLVAALLSPGLCAAAAAQIASCDQLNSQLASFDRDRDYRNAAQFAADARALQANIQRLESAFVRNGCQRALNAGQRPSRDCRALANQITRSRADYAQLVDHANRGAQVAQLRESVLQQIARFGCNANSSTVTFGGNTRQQDRGGLLARIFRGLGLTGNNIVGDQWNYIGRSTLRTVCVRSCDGYYWPVSFSTVEEYLVNDAAVCSNQCPMADVQLYYYHNPGEEVEDMVNLQGGRYADLPNAFKYREEFNSACTCQQQVNFGTIELAGADGDIQQPVISFGELRFPLPRRDPRRASEIAVAEAQYVPLPRRRPAQAGEPVVAVPAPISTANLRIVNFGDKPVRIVGPDTPYVPSPAAGS